MSPAESPQPRASAPDQARVLDVVRALALEVGGARAASAVSPDASLERDVGLGSLERVELLTRLEDALGRELDDRILTLDSAAEIARALGTMPVVRSTAPSAEAPAPSTSAFVLGDVPTLSEALRQRAAADPGRVHVHLHEGERSRPVTYGELWDGAARIATALAARGVRPGETVGIMLPTGLDFLQTFMGVVAAGAVAVPLYPPVRLDRIAEYLTRQSRILANAEARLLVAMPEAAPVADLLRKRVPTLASVESVDALRGAAAGPIAGRTDASALALIQYTSGSTGDPKGVPLTHANLLANIRAIAEGVAMQPTDFGVSWLPLYHDMGLIGTWLCTMVQGIPLALLSPLAFLARPERWLWIIHAHRATLAPAPNFAYELCVRKVRDEALEGLDLSTWRCALNGSEPVSDGTIERFATRFARHGFRREALMPVYGLAESAVALCFPPVGRGPRVDRVARAVFSEEGRAAPAAADDASAVRFVSVGRVLRGHELRVVDEQGGEVEERVVGRVLFRGPSCTSGYYRNPEATARTIGPGGWIDSGDLAYRADGELFVTGRVKDLVIKGGRNLVPQEVEEAAGNVSGVRKGRVVALGVMDERSGTEQLVLIVESREESRDERARIERDVIAAVSDAVGVPPDRVHLLPPGAVPITPSGKLRRSAARELFDAGQLGQPPRVPLRVRAALLGGVAARGWSRMRREASGTLQAGYVVVVSAVMGAPLLAALALLGRLLPRGRPVRGLTRVASRVALRLGGCRLHVEGGERLPARGPMVLVANHASYADTAALLAALPIDFVFAAMSEILDWRLIGMLVRRGENLTVYRWDVRRSLEDARTVESRLRAGAAVLFFAEGGLRRAAGLRPFRLGAFEAAAAAGAPVVPIALRGTRHVLPAGARIPRPGAIDVWIGEPIVPDGATWGAALRLRDRAADAIAARCGEPRLDRTVADPSFPPGTR